MAARGFKKYLTESNFYDYYKLSGRNNLTLHWSDSSVACQHLRELISIDKIKRESFFQMMESLEDYKKSIICVKLPHLIDQISIFDLYSKYHRGKLTSYLGGHTIEFSMVSDHGPFHKMHIDSFLNRNVYLKFVFRDIVEHTINTRKFRLRCRENCICHYGEGLKRSTILQIRQFSRNGFLCSVENQPEFFEVLRSRSGELQILLDLEIFKMIDRFKGDVSGFLGHVLSNHESGLFFTQDPKKNYFLNPKELILVEDSIPSVIGLDEKYFFIPYDRFSSRPEEIGHIMVNFVDTISKEIVGQ